MTSPLVLPVPGGSVADSVRALVEALTDASDSTVVVAADLIVAPAALAPVTQDRFAGTSMLVRPSGRSGNVRVRHHLVTSVGSGSHDVTAPDHVSIGALVISAKDATRARSELSGLVDVLASGALQSDGHDVVELVAAALVRGEVAVKAVDLVDVPWFRSPDDTEAAHAATREISDDRIARLQANRVDDGFYSTFVVRRLSKPLTRVALRLGLSPNTVTVMSFIIGLAAAAAFAVGERWGLVLGAVLLQLSLIVDCVDGEVARATRRFTAVGAWLDASTDRVKEFLAYAGLAYGASRFGIGLWWIAVVLVVVQTTRHMTDYDFSRIQRMREAHVPRISLCQRDDGAAGSAGGWSVAGAMEFSTRINRRDAVRWAKRALHMPIGERWLVISVLAAVLGAAWALGGLLVLGLVAFTYVIAGRTLRSLTWHGHTPAAGVTFLRRQSDSGPLLALVSELAMPRSRPRMWTGRFAWAIPAVLRFVELAVVAAIAFIWVPAAIPVAFWWMAVVAFHHYDTLYRAMQDAAAPRWLTWLSLGWDGRTILVVVLASVGVLVAGLTWATWLLAAVVVVAASVQWLLVQRRQS